MNSAQHPIDELLPSAPTDRPVETPVSANRVYFPALDGIRAMAFLMVFAGHYLRLPWGWAGVDVFFVLSGFLITGILFDTRNQLHRVRNFYVRRTLRIFPLYYGVMLFLVTTYPAFRWRWTWAWLLWPAYLGNFLRGIHPFTQDSPLQLLADFQPLSRIIPNFRFYLGHFWSLCVEEQFYLIWPWVVFSIRDRMKLIGVCLAAVLVCPVFRVLGAHVLPGYMLGQEVLYRWTPFRVDALLLGGLIALLARGNYSRRLLQAARIGLWGMTLIATVWLFREYLAYHAAKEYLYPGWEFTWGLVFVDLFSACLIVNALEPSTWIFRLFQFRPLRWIGTVSYGAYVFHDIFHVEITACVYAAGITQHTDWVIAAFALGFTLLLSWASFRWFETPFIRLKERWAPSLTSNAGG